MNYSFLSDALLDRFDPGAAGARVRLANPLTADHTVMRDALLPQVVENIGLNVSRQVEECAFFETGRVFRLAPDGTPSETDRLAVALFGPVGRTGLDKYAPVTELDMYLWTKGLWTQLAETLNLRGACLRPADRPWGAPGRGMEITIAGKPAGWLGLLAPEIAAKWRIHSPVGVIEVDQWPLLKDVTLLKKLSVPPTYPSTRRDVALIVDSSVKHEQVLKIAKKAAPPELEKIELFDIYEGKNLSGRKSMAYAFTYRSPKSTLTDAQANTFQQKINAALKEKLPAEIREG